MPTRRKESLNQASLSPFLRRTIRRNLWGIGHAFDDTRDLTVDSYYPYFAFYQAQCRSVARHGGRELWATDHEELVEVIRYVKAGDQTRESLISKLQEQRVVADMVSIEDTIELAARLLLMLSIGNPKNCLTPGQRMIEWKSGTLKKLVTDRFSPTHVSGDHVKLPRLFNALQLVKIAGLKVAWTNNLADHLLLREDDTKVCIFHHVSFLQCHKLGDWYAI